MWGACARRPIDILVKLRRSGEAANLQDHHLGLLDLVAALGEAPQTHLAAACGDGSSPVHRERHQDVVSIGQLAEALLNVD
jgi:hypothetical protein